MTFVIAAYLAAKGGIEGIMSCKFHWVPGRRWLLFDALITLAIATAIACTWPVSASSAIGLLVGVAMISSGFARLMVSVAVRRLHA